MLRERVSGQDTHRFFPERPYELVSSCLITCCRCAQLFQLFKEGPGWNSQGSLCQILRAHRVISHSTDRSLRASRKHSSCSMIMDHDHGWKQECRLFRRVCQDQDLGMHQVNVTIHDVFLKKQRVCLLTSLLPTLTEGAPGLQA